MTLPPEAEAKDTKLIEESVNEANAINEGVQDIDLDAAGAPGEGEESKRDENGQSSHPIDQSSAKPGSAGNQDSQPKIDAIDWDKVGKLYKPESAIEHIVSREMGRLSKGFAQQIDLMDIELEDKYGKGKKK